LSTFNIPDYIITQAATSTPPSQIPYGIRMIGAPLEWPETQGEGIKLAILDTGRPSHPDIVVTGSKYFSNNTEHDRDLRGHGSHCCGSAAARNQTRGVAPGVDIFALKVFPDSGGADPWAIAQALDWCRENGIHIVSMSFCGPEDNVNIRQAVQRCHAAGIVMVAAAGNFGRDWGVMYPAKYPEVIAVAAVDIAKKPADWSAYGMELDVAAAGVDVWSTWLNSQYVELSGTSMACPHIAGACAIIQAKAKKRLGRLLTPAEVKDRLQLDAEDLGPVGKDERYGFGVFSFGRFGSLDSDTVRRQVEMWIGQRGYLVDGRPAEMDTAPFIKDGRTFVPVRFISEGLSDEVGWDSLQQKVTITRPGVR
jgi:subtilisin family serine protease